MSQHTLIITQQLCQRISGVIAVDSVPHPMIKEQITGRRTFLLEKWLVKKPPGETLEPVEEAPGSRGSAGGIRIFRTTNCRMNEWVWEFHFPPSLYEAHRQAISPNSDWLLEAVGLANIFLLRLTSNAVDPLFQEIRYWREKNGRSTRDPSRVSRITLGLPAKMTKHFAVRSWELQNCLTSLVYGGMCRQRSPALSVFPFAMASHELISVFRSA